MYSRIVDDRLSIEALVDANRLPAWDLTRNGSCTDQVIDQGLLIPGFHDEDVDLGDRTAIRLDCGMAILLFNCLSRESRRNDRFIVKVPAQVRSAYTLLLVAGSHTLCSEQSLPGGRWPGLPIPTCPLSTDGILAQNISLRQIESGLSVTSFLSPFPNSRRERPVQFS